MDSKQIAKLLGKNGGEKTLKLHGKEHYKQMGIKSGVSRKKAKQSQKIPILTN